MNLITPQTSKEGKKVHQVLVAEDVYYPGPSETEEFYVSITQQSKCEKYDYVFYRGRSRYRNSCGEDTHLIHTLDVDPKIGLTEENATGSY